MNYNQISATLDTLTALYRQLAEIYNNWDESRQAELDQLKQEIEQLEAQYGNLKK